MGLADSWDLSPGPGPRTRMRPDPPQYFFGGGSINPRQENRGSDGRARSPCGTRSSSERRGREDIGQRNQDEGGQSSTSHSGPRQGSRGTTRNLDGSRSQSRRRNRGSSAGSRRDGSQESGGAGERSRGAGGGREEEEYDDSNTEDEEERRDPRGSGRAASPRRSRPPSGRNFRGYQPGDAQPSPVLQGVVNCLTSISNQMLRMSGKSGKNGGWPYFDGVHRVPRFQEKVAELLQEPPSADAPEGARAVIQGELPA